MVKQYDFMIERQGIAIEFHLVRIGLDYLVMIEGGDVPHIGAISIGNAKEHMGQQLINLPGHKESVITEAVYARLSGLCSHTICIIGGVHINHITRTQIQLVLEMCEEAGDRLAERMVHEIESPAS